MRYIVFKIIFLSFLFSFSCFKRQNHPYGPPEWPRYELKGVVLDSINSDPLDGCIVTIATAISSYPAMWVTAMTDSNGAFLIDSVYPGGYWIIAERDSYLTDTGRVMVEHEDKLDYRMSILRISDAPDILVHPDNFDITARTPGGAHHTLLLSNTGNAVPLMWNFKDIRVDWLAVNLMDGVLPPHEGQTVNIQFIASEDMNPGIYKGNLIIESNDPLKRRTSIPIKFNIKRGGSHVYNEEF